jgi:hypothetical protein
MIALDATRVVDAYSRAFRHLQRLEGIDLPTLLTAEAGVILKTWAGKVKVSKPQEVDDRARYVALRSLGATKAENVGDVSINAGIRGPTGLVWIRTRSGRAGGRKTGGRPFHLAGRMSTDGRFVAVHHHFKNRDWSEIMDTVLSAEAKIKLETERGRKSVGLARQSVVQIADDLGIDLLRVRGGGNLSAAGLAKARAATSRTGLAYRNGMGTRATDGDRSFVDLVNRLPYGSKINLGGQLLTILRGRAKYLETAVSKGALDSVRNAHRAFPEVFRLAF